MIEEYKVLSFEHESPYPMMRIDKYVMILLATDDFVAREVLELNWTQEFALLSPE
jgi:hypothetical protein